MVKRREVLGLSLFTWTNELRRQKNVLTYDYRIERSRG